MILWSKNIQVNNPRKFSVQNVSGLINQKNVTIKNFRIINWEKIIKINGKS